MPREIELASGCFFGRLHRKIGRRKRRFRFARRARAVSHETKPQIKIVFAGEGAAREELQTRAQQMGLADRVLFLPPRPQRELPAVMNAIDVLVLPSRTTPSWKEQFGRVLIEAHACGVPTIGSSSGAIPDVIENAGLVFPEGDAPPWPEYSRRCAMIRNTRRNWEKLVARKSKPNIPGRARRRSCERFIEGVFAEA